MNYPSHDDAIALVERARACVTLATVADAFIASLGAGQLALRSALGSYMIARHLPRHPFTPTAVYSTKYICGVCGYGHTAGAGDPLDLAEDDETRQRFGVLLVIDNPTRIAADLDHFAGLTPPAPTEADNTVLREIITAIERAGSSATRASAEKLVASVLKSHGLRSNTYQRRGLLELLGWCDVLAPKDRPGFLDAYVPFDQRPERNESGYPFGYWSGADGVNWDAVRVVFPRVFGVVT